ncbi:MAG: hypothetical protein ACYCSO_03630 [Cuniculiplasma sp.]
MTESGSKKNFEDSDRIISASELAEYDYCALSWHFTREGYRIPAEYKERMNRGTMAHEEAHMDHQKNSTISITLVVAIVLVAVFMLVVFL